MIQLLKSQKSNLLCSTKTTAWTTLDREKWFRLRSQRCRRPVFCNSSANLHLTLWICISTTLVQCCLQLTHPKEIWILLPFNIGHPTTFLLINKASQPTSPCKVANQILQPIKEKIWTSQLTWNIIYPFNAGATFILTSSLSLLQLFLCKPINLLL